MSFRRRAQRTGLTTTVAILLNLLFVQFHSQARSVGNPGHFGAEAQRRSVLILFIVQRADKITGKSNAVNGLDRGTQV